MSIDEVKEEVIIAFNKARSYDDIKCYLKEIDKLLPQLKDEIHRLKLVQCRECVQDWQMTLETLVMYLEVMCRGV